jgi:5-methylcytosine-specific restriction protein A
MRRNDDKLDNFSFGVDEAFIRAERNKARDLRRSRWWQQKTAPGLCHYCQHKFPPGELTMDHVVPSKATLFPAANSATLLKKPPFPLSWSSYNCSAQFLHSCGLPGKMRVFFKEIQENISENKRKGLLFAKKQVYFCAQ